jgi:hypothetical protein
LGRSDILLGPEGTSVPPVVGVAGFLGSGPARIIKLPVVPAVWWVLGVCGGWWVGGWSLFENCTVDASIFVVKLPRADGECLGTRSR